MNMHYMCGGDDIYCSPEHATYILVKKLLRNHAANEPIGRPTDRPTNQSINQQTNTSTNQGIN